MRVYSRIVIDIETSQVLEADYENYSGPIALLKMSKDQGYAAYMSKQMMNGFMGDMKQRFGEQSAIFKQLTDVNSAIWNQGPDQEGWGAQQKAAINTLTNQTVAQNYQMAKAATGSALAGVGGGGNTFLPSSVGAGLAAQNANAAMAQRSQLQNQNIISNFEQGRQNWLNSGKMMMGTAQMEDPSIYGKLGLTANDQYFNQATDIFKQEQAAKQAQWGAIGGAAQMAALAIPVAGPFISAGIGGAMGGAGMGGGGMSGMGGFKLPWGGGNPSTMPSSGAGGMAGPGGFIPAV